MIILSLFIVAFSQPAWVPKFGVFAASFGFALFWRSLFKISSFKRRFFLSLIWFVCVQAVQLSWMTSVDYMGPMILIVYGFLILGMGVQFALLSSWIREPVHLYRNNLKNREFGKKGSQNFCSERVTIAERQGTSENKNSEINPTPLKTDSSDCFGIRQMLAISGCWVIFEWMRLFFSCGFTWNQVGMALTHSHYSMQFASIFGILGLSFWVILTNLAALKAMVEKSRKSILVWGGLTMTPYIFGWMQQMWVESAVPISGQLKVALVQTGLYPEQKDFDPEIPNAYIPPLAQWKRILNVLKESEKIDLIVFPEAAFPLGAHLSRYSLEDAKSILKEEAFPPLKRPYAMFDFGKWRLCNAFFIQTLANQTGAHIITGLDDRDLFGQYNAAFHFTPQSTKYERYEKQILVPVGEYMPLQFLPKFSTFLSQQFGIYNSFKAGKESQIFNAHFPIGVSICFEETFSSLIRKIRLKGAQLFVNLTNDAWFPHSKLAQQHFDHGKVRAVENGVAVLRACNTGITGVIDCFGRTIKTLSSSEIEPAVLYLSVPIRSYATLYTLWGDGGILTLSFSALVGSFCFHKKKLL